MNDYCRLIDVGDIEGFARLFERGSWGVEGEPGGPAVGAAQVRERLSAVPLYDGLPRTMHLMSNVDIAIDSDTSAYATSVITVMQAVPPQFPLQAIFVGRYPDRFMRDGDEWYFEERVIEARLVGDMSFHRPDMA